MSDLAAPNGRAQGAPKAEPVGTDYPDAFPSSHKVWVEGERGVRVPMREIRLSGGEPPLRVYDTSGPRGIDVRQGLPALRDAWIRGRPVRETGRSRPLGDAGVEMPEALGRRTLRGTVGVTQMTFARRGEVTPEMEFVALREGVEPGFVRDQVARGRAIIPANINHPVNYNSSAYLNAANTLQIPGWTRFDIGARYRIERTDEQPIIVRASIDNVFDVDYWVTDTGGYLALSEPLTFKLSTTFNF
jgi:hypothetical protein